MTAPSTPSIWDLPQAPLPPWLGPHGSSEFVVVGLGGSGLAAVHHLLDAGRQVLGLDAGQVGQSAAGRNGGFLLAGSARFHHEAVRLFGPDVARGIYRETVDAICAMQAETPRAVSLTGSVRRPHDAAEVGDIEAHLDALRADGFGGESRSGGELWIPDDGVFHPQERLDSLVERALRRGAWLHGDTRVLAVSPGEVLTSRGSIACQRVIIAIDGGLELLVPTVAANAKTVRLQMLATEPTSDVQIHGAVYHRYGYDYWQQRPDGRIALGGGRDVGGEAEWGAPAEPSEAVQEELDRLLREVVGSRAAVTHRWAAQVAYSDDHLPLLEEVAPGVWATGAYSGTGNVMGWLGGRAAADRAMGWGSSWADLLISGRAAVQRFSGPPA